MNVTERQCRDGLGFCSRSLSVYDRTGKVLHPLSVYVKFPRVEFVTKRRRTPTCLSAELYEIFYGMESPFEEFRSFGSFSRRSDRHIKLVKRARAACNLAFNNA